MKRQLYPATLLMLNGSLSKHCYPNKVVDGHVAWHNGRCSLAQRQVLNAIWLVVVSSVQWRLLPREYPCWQTVYYHFRRWSGLGYWKRVHHLLRALVLNNWVATSIRLAVVWIVRAPLFAQMNFVAQPHFWP